MTCPFLIPHLDASQSLLRGWLWLHHMVPQLRPFSHLSLMLSVSQSAAINKTLVLLPLFI